MAERIIQNPEEMNTILAVTLRTLLVDKMGGEVEGADQFSYTAPMKNIDTGEEETYMISFDASGNYAVEEIRPGRFPDHKILLFSEDKEDAIVNAAVNGHGFWIEEESGENPDPFDERY